MVVDKVIENVAKVAVTAVWTTFCGVLSYDFIKSTKIENQRHEVRQSKLKAEYDAVVAKNEKK